MLTILILLLLAFGFYTGAKRGLILQVLYSVSRSLFSDLFTWINIYSSFETGKWTIRWRIKCSCIIRGSFSSVSYGVNDSVRYCPKSVSVKWLGTRHCKKYPNSNKTSI